MMQPNEIKKKIDENNRRIEAIFNPAAFVLNEEVAALLKENSELREQCIHDFDENGLCIYCYARKEDN